MKRALVTGAAGFVGSHLTRYLQKRGLEVWGSFLARAKKFDFPIHWLQADLTDFKQTLQLVKKSRPHYIFHLAGQAVPRESWKKPEDTLQVNTVASIYLLESILRVVPRARVVLISSAQVYGAAAFLTERLSEENVADPLNPYAGSKFLMEMAGLNYVKRHGLFVVIARAFNQVGVGQNPNFAFSDFCRQVVSIEKGKKHPLLEVGNLDVIRDFIHVKDAAQAYYLMAIRGKKGGIYNMGSGKGTHLKKVVDFLTQESRVPFQIKSSISRFHKNDIHAVIANTSRLRKLGWKPTHSIWQALREMLDEWRDIMSARRS